VWDWIGTQYGNLASVAGLFISAWSVWVATGARKAAREARTVAQQRSLAEDLGDLQRRSNVAHLCISQGSLQVGSFVLSELRVSIHRLLGQWGETLTIEVGNKLLTSSQRLDAIQGLISRSPDAPLPEEVRRRVVVELQGIDAEFSELMGQGLRLVAGHD
jgi:hypothetical protein